MAFQLSRPLTRGVRNVEDTYNFLCIDFFEIVHIGILFEGIFWAFFENVNTKGDIKKIPISTTVF